MLGAGGAQLVSLLAAPVIARLFAPEDFGVAALFMSIAAVAVIPTTLRLEHAIVLPKEDAESFTVISVAILSVLGFCFLGFLSLAVVNFLDVSLVVNSKLGTAVFLLPIAVLFIGATNIATGCAVRTKSFTTVGSSNLAQSIFVVFSRILTGIVAGSSVIALVVTALFSSLVKLLVLIRGVKYPITGLFVFQQYRSIKKVIYEYRQFPLYSIPTGLLRTFNDNLPIFLLATLFTPQVVGLYAMASRLVKAPMTVISEPIRLAYLQKTSELLRQNKSVVRSLLLLTSALFILALLFILPLSFFGRELFQLVLGPKWADAGIYAAIVAPWFASICVQMPSSCIYIVAKKQKRLLWLQSVTTVAMCISMAFVAVLKLDAINALIALSVIGTLLNLMIILNAYFIARRL